MDRTGEIYRKFNHLFFNVVLILDMGTFIPEKYFSRQIFPVNSFD